MLRIKEAVVLAGGLGTRLRSVVADIPKPMALINDTPFLSYLLQYLKSYGVNRVVLSVGYKYEVIKAFFGENYLGIDLVYAVEKEPLGTGGGIKFALSLARDKHVFLLNGDTFFHINLHHLSDHFMLEHALVSLSLKEMSNFDRYGIVNTDKNRVVGFKDKAFCAEGWINGGVYALQSQLFSAFPLPDVFSFEKDFLEQYYNQAYFSAFLSKAYFIDIGIPEDYARAQTELKQIELFSSI